MRTKQRNNLAETARHERVAQNTDVYAVKARNYKGLRRGSPVLCRNNWHIHHAKSGGGQILVCVAGRGFYQEEGRDAVEMKPGDCINIPVDVKHWHGAAPQCGQLKPRTLIFQYFWAYILHFFTKIS